MGETSCLAGYENRREVLFVSHNLEAIAKNNLSNTYVEEVQRLQKRTSPLGLVETTDDILGPVSDGVSPCLVATSTAQNLNQRQLR